MPREDETDQIAPGEAGTLLLSSGENVPYRLCEIARYSIGILSALTIEPGTFLTLKHRSTDIQLRVISSLPAKGQVDGIHRYVMAVLDTRHNLEEILEALLDRLVRSGDELRFARFMTAPRLKARISTFGSGSRFSCLSINVSKTGLLLSPGKKTPIRKGTLLEIELEGMENVDPTFNETFLCTGTVVRETSVPLGDHEEMAYGIALSGWSEEKRRRWEDWIRQLELRLVREQLGEVESPDDEKAS